MARNSLGLRNRLLIVLLVVVSIIFGLWSVFERSHTTILGDALSATPWQRWQRWPNYINLRRAKEIAHCNGVACAEVVGKLARNQSVVGTCPAYFDWIDKDLKTWQRRGGISQWDVHSAQRDAAFRVLIVDGKLYVDPYYSCHIGRATFNIWGLLMLLERFPGQIKDVDLMFNCADRPRVFKRHWWMRSRPLFGYSTMRDGSSLDIPFPDWSFWAWPEKGITHWEQELTDIVRESALEKWTNKEQYAYWKGDFQSSKPRMNLLKCNSSDQLHLYAQDWESEASSGFKNSKLSKQCKQKYKIYAEGNAWSVSYKYILACGSTVLSIAQEYVDFFSRALTSSKHYVPITNDKHIMCEDLSTKLSWLNAHPSAAEKIGRQGQEFVKKELNMERVYDYMFHLLSRYSKLQKFKPKVPPTARRVCPERLKCLADPELRKIMEALPRPSPSVACSMPDSKS